MSHHHPTPCDFFIVGAGILGITTALALKRKHPESHIILIEKESAPGLHASGRNSGVLHAGFYYTPESLKTRFCKEGNIALTQYCLEKKLPINQCGKLVVTRNEEDLAGLHTLLQRGKENKIELYLLDEQQAKEIEPQVKTYQKALFSPHTSSVDSSLIIKELTKDLHRVSIQLQTNEVFLKNKKNIIHTNKNHYDVGFLINASGLYADKIAKQFGFSKNYEILPFKGLYLYGNKSALVLRTHIYPVPNLKNPFLGVHFTLNAYHDVKIGPTAIPALWREHYTGLKNFKFQEMKDIFLKQLSLFLRSDFNFRKLAVAELKKYNKQVLLKQADALIESLPFQDFKTWGKPGIRAQLFDTQNKKLEMDFVLEGDEHSFHILNAVSPAFTCALPFADYISQHLACIEKKIF